MAGTLHWTRVPAILAPDPGNMVRRLSASLDEQSRAAVTLDAAYAGVGRSQSPVEAGTGP